MNLDVLEQQETDSPFGAYEEEAIISLIIDHPDFFASISRFLNYQLFKRPEVQYVAAHLLDYREKYDVYPSRGILRDNIMKSLTVDDEYAEDILAIVERESDPREIPAIKDKLLEWAKTMSYERLYDPETISRFKNGDTDFLHEIVEESSRIKEISSKGLWFFDELEKLFIEEEKDKTTTGFYELDRAFDEGGPNRKEMMVTMAPTGVGKSILLINQALANVKKGFNVLFITLELSDLKSALRAIGSLTNQSMKHRHDPKVKDTMLSMAKRIKDSGAGDLVFFEFPPDEIGVNEIYALIDDLRKTRSWVPDVVVVDYLELMVSRRQSDNKEDYVKQKACSTQLRGLAQNENVTVYTATQTNRSGNDADKMLDVTKISESYGKAMPMDYLVSINQTEDEYNEVPARAHIYVAKNRNGPKFISFEVKINYETMRIEELSL